MLKENIYNFRTVLLTVTGCLHYTFVMCGPLAKHRVFSVLILLTWSSYGC